MRCNCRVTPKNPCSGNSVFATPMILKCVAAGRGCRGQGCHPPGNSWKLLEILDLPGNSWYLLYFERKSLILLEISWNFPISMFQRFVLESFTADTM